MDLRVSVCSAPSTRALDALLSGGAGPTMVFQPVVELRSGAVAGYEALARFDSPADAGPRAWFHAADVAGLGAEFQALALRSAVRALPSLPPGQFLGLNLSPAHLEHPLVRAALRPVDPCRVVLELTEQVPAEGRPGRLASLARLRDAGFRLAVDEADTGTTGRSNAFAADPTFVKLDRRIVAGVLHDRGRRDLVESVLAVARYHGAQVVAVGIERPEVLDCLAGLGVRLGQGWLLGPPGPPWGEVPDRVADDLRARAAASGVDGEVGALAESAPACRPEAVAGVFADHDELDWVVVVDAAGWPIGLQARHDELHRVAMRVPPGISATAAAVRARRRRADRRDDPLVCCGGAGDLRGIVRVERLPVATST